VHTLCLKLFLQLQLWGNTENCLQSNLYLYLQSIDKTYNTNVSNKVISLGTTEVSLTVN